MCLNSIPTVLLLLNPTKPELGKVSKKKLEIIVKIVREKSQLNHWTNTQDVIMWFNQFNDINHNRERLHFINFDIIDFYPSISKKLLSNAIKFAEKFVKISDEDKRLFFHVRKSYLINEGKPWVKKENENFDVTQGAFDSAEVSELVGLFLLSEEVLEKSGYSHKLKFEKEIHQKKSKKRRRSRSF